MLNEFIDKLFQNILNFFYLPHALLQTKSEIIQKLEQAIQIIENQHLESLNKQYLFSVLINKGYGRDDDSVIDQNLRKINARIKVTYLQTCLVFLKQPEIYNF